VSLKICTKILTIFSRFSGHRQINAADDVILNSNNIFPLLKVMVFFF